MEWETPFHKYGYFIMHELAVTQSVLSIALEAAEDAATQHGAWRITAIDLVIGELSGYVDDSVQFYFDMLSEGTPAAGATLRFHREPAQAYCQSCQHEFAVTPPLDPACPHCGGTDLSVTGGTAFYVESIEVEDENTGRERDTVRQLDAG